MGWAALRAGVPLWAATVWWTSLTLLGAFVVPMLFAHLPSPSIAGNMAARLFSGQTAISVACALLALFSLRTELWAQARALGADLAPWLLGGALLALLVEFGVAPHIVARDNLKFWHAVASAMYLLQWLCALYCMLRLTAADRNAQP